MIVSLFLLLACLLFLEAFFSGSEMALISCDRIKIRHRAGEGSRGAQVAEQLLQRPDHFLATTLVGTNLCVVTSSAIAALLCLSLLGEGREYYATVLLTPLVLLLGEMVPKAYFRHHADHLAPLLAPPLKLCLRLFSPLTSVIHHASILLLSPLRISPAERDPYITREELKFLVREGDHQADLATEERRMIHKIFHFGETTVQEAMIPLIDVVALPREAPVAEAVAVVSEHHFSRIPVYEGRIDHILGIVHAFDLLSADPQASLDPLIRPAYYVPETKLVDDLLQEMQRGRVQMAIVVDEYGGVVGIVTVEDLLEEIVGEIEDEYDEEPPPLRRLPDGSYMVDARMEVDRLSEELGLTLPEGEYETVGGLLLHLLQKIPDAGEEAQYAGIRFLVTEADKRSILKVKIRPPERLREKGRRP
ncbi:MAG: hemolysin family protein [Candidatus Methylomirabilales bacterium]